MGFLLPLATILTAAITTKTITTTSKKIVKRRNRAINKKNV